MMMLWFRDFFYRSW